MDENNAILQRFSWAIEWCKDHKNLNLKFTNTTDFEAADTWDIKDDERIRKAIEDFNKVKGNLPTLDLKKLEELIRQELKNILHEKKKANIHTK